MRLAFIVIGLLLISACATAPSTYGIDNSRVYNKPYDEVWSDVMGFFTTSNIQIKTVEKESGIVYAESMRFTDQQADCGTPGINKVVGRQMSLNIFVKENSDNQTAATVNTNFIETRRFADQPAFAVECNSKGTVEAAILSSL